jgi:hypothetical protein
MLSLTDLDVTERLDSGRNGTVFKAIDKSGRSYAVKVILGPVERLFA